jgi:hypothetical protein
MKISVVEHSRSDHVLKQNNLRVRQVHLPRWSLIRTERGKRTFETLEAVNLEKSLSFAA